MRKLTYLAVLEPSADGYGIYFPDLPGCISFGKDIEDSQQMTREALELHIYCMEKDNDPIPEPSRSLDKEAAETGIITAITVFPDLVKNDMENRQFPVIFTQTENAVLVRSPRFRDTHQGRRYGQCN